MAKSIDEVTKGWSKARRDRVGKRGLELLAEYDSLQALRKASDLTQVAVAEKLGVSQARLSKLEQGTDMYISTLRDYIAALGGTLQITAEFPEHPPIFLRSFHVSDSFEEISLEPTPRPTSKSGPRKRTRATA